MLNEQNREVTVEGVLKNLRWSQSNNTLYLEFSDDSSREDVRGYCLPRNADETLSEQALKPLIGKRIQMSGVVRIVSYFKIQWPEVLIKDRAAIKEVK